MVSQNISISTGTLVRAILLILLVVVGYLLGNIIMIFLTSVVISSFTESAVHKLSKFKFPRTLSVLLVYFVSLSIVAGTLYVFTPVLLSQAGQLAEFMSKYFPASNTLNEATISGAKSFVENLGHGFSLSNFASTAERLALSASGGFLQSMSFLFGGIINLILIIVISFYLSVQEKGIENFLRIILPKKNEEYIIGLWHRSQRKIALWVKGQLVLAIFCGILAYLGLSLLGVKYALLIAVATTIAEMIPFGIVFVAIAGVALAYSSDGGSLALMVGLFFLILQQFENYLLQPLVVNKVIGISPLVVILALVIGVTLAGFWGLVLAIPVAVFLLEILNDIEKQKIARN